MKFYGRVQSGKRSKWLDFWIVSEMHKKQDCPHFLLTKDNKHISKISIYFDTSRILFKSEMTHELQVFYYFKI